MSWNTDKEPIDYLRQRIKYYRGKMSNAKNWTKNPIMVEKYGDQLSYIIARSIIRNKSFIEMFEKAVKDLERINKCSGRQIDLTDEKMQRLTEIYSTNRVCVATVCDEVLDRSGALLGDVRDLYLKTLNKKNHETNQI